VGAEGRRALSGATQGKPGLDRDRLRLGSGGRRLVRGDVVSRQGTRQLVIAQGLEVAGGGEVPGPPLTSGEGAMGDLAGE